MDSIWAELALKIVEICPYAACIIIAFACAYFMFKVTINAIKSQSEKAIEEMRKAFDDALRRIP